MDKRMKKEFKPGELVKLKSGGPDMVVEYDPENQRANGHIDCIWFQATFRGAELCHASFDARNLQRVE